MYFRCAFQLLFSFFSSAIWAKEPLTMDRKIPTDAQFNFANPNNLSPQRSDFKVVSAIPMSSETGERWALLTIKNLAHGNRTLNQRHLLATFADGSRIHPAEFSQAFKADETLSISVYFTDSTFPMIFVTSNPN